MLGVMFTWYFIKFSFYFGLWFYMRVIYKKNIVERINDEITYAANSGRLIERIELTSPEFESFRMLTCKSYPGSISFRDNDFHNGISIVRT